MHFDYQSGSTDSIITSNLACEQALHLGDIVKRRRARGTREARERRRELRRSLAQIGGGFT